MDKKGIWILIIGLTCLSFSVRLTNFYNHKKTHRVTIDENAFYSIALQLKENPLIYNTNKYISRSKNRDKLLPYLFDPLFKHPPLFSYLLTTSLVLFKEATFSVVLIPLLFGCLLIPLTFLLGSLLGGDKVGLLSAFLIAIDPVSIICSQKVWLDTTLAFFALLAVYFYARAFLTARPKLFLWGGFAIGLAVLTKYPGILMCAAVIFYVSLFDREWHENSCFRLSLAIPWVMLVPWIIWNLNVYGLGFFKNIFTKHGIHLTIPVFSVIFLSCAALGVCVFFPEKGKGCIRHIRSKFQLTPQTLKRIRIGLLLVLVYLLFQPVMSSLSFSHFPETSWNRYTFSREGGVFFYLKRLPGFSLFYILSYLAFFLSSLIKKTPRILFVELTGLLSFLFFSLYGNYQSRYVLMVLPLLMILAAFAMFRVFERIQDIKDTQARAVSFVLFVLFLCVSLAKVMTVNFHVSFPNDMCYF